MLRAVGVLLLAGSGLTMGLGAVERMARTRRDLTDLAAAISQAEGELALSFPSTPVLLEVLAGQAGGRAGAFFTLCSARLNQLGERDFDAIWSAALAASELSLSGEVLRQMETLGRALERYDADQLLRCCRQTRKSVEAEADRLGEQLRSQGKVYGTLGLTMGIFCAILLL